MTDFTQIESSPYRHVHVVKAHVRFIGPRPIKVAAHVRGGWKEQRRRLREMIKKDERAAAEPAAEAARIEAPPPPSAPPVSETDQQIVRLLRQISLELKKLHTLIDTMRAGG